MRRLKGRSRRTRFLQVSGVVAGTMTAFFVAAAATNWTVGLNSGSDGEAQSATISNLTISAIASPGTGNLLFPGGTGDVVLKISNPNVFPVKVEGFKLPQDTAQADGYSSSAVNGTPIVGCDSTSSKVTWVGALNGSNADVTLTDALVVPAAFSGSAGTLSVTLTNEAQMDMAAPRACAGVYLKMPAFSDVDASGGAFTASTDPSTDDYS